MDNMVAGIAAFIASSLLVAAIIALAARTMKSWGEQGRSLRREVTEMRNQMDDMRRQIDEIMRRLG